MIDFILRPFRRNFGKDKAFYAAIDDMFGFIPNNIELYKLALIHKSASVMTDDGRQINNERLEYLGDAVIETVTSDYLFIEYPDMNEGFLTQLRSKMVSRQTLNEVAKRIGLDDYVISHTSASMSQKHIYGDAFEAMMGAIYLDQGYDFVNRLLINKIFANHIKADNLAEAETDFKSRLIEWCQKNHHSIRFFTHNDKSYSAAHPFFYCKVLIDNIEVGYGAGDSKKEAEQRAAYSVAQGVSEGDCTKLMDRLDMLETKQLQKAGDGARNEKNDEQTKVKEQKKSELKAAEPKRESEPVNDAKPVQKPVQKSAQKPESKQNAVVAEREDVSSQEQLVANVNEKDVTPNTGAEANHKPRRNRTRKSVAQTTSSQESAEKTTDVETEKQGKSERPTPRKSKPQKIDNRKSEQPGEEQSTEVAKPAVEKTSKSRRSRSRAKSIAEAEQSLNSITENVNALIVEVEQIEKLAKSE